MQTEYNYKTKSTINILIASMTLLLLAIFIFKLDIPCLFKHIFNINCPACGLTRSFYAILDLNFINALNYNILGIPLFISIILIYIIYFIDLITKKDNLIRLYNKMIKYYHIIILVLILNTILNNIK